MPYPFFSRPLVRWVSFDRGSDSTARSRYNARCTSELVRTGSEGAKSNEKAEYYVDGDPDDEDYKKQEVGVRVLIGLIKRSAWWIVLLLVLVAVCALSIYLMHRSLASGVTIGDGLKPSLFLNSEGGGITNPYRRSAEVIRIDGRRGGPSRIPRDEIGQ